MQHCSWLVAPIRLEYNVTQGLAKRAFRADMQRQYDAHAHLPRAGATREVLGSFFFQPYIGCQEMSKAKFVAWQVKVALGLLPAPDVFSHD